MSVVTTQSGGCLFGSSNLRQVARPAGWEVCRPSGAGTHPGGLNVAAGARFLHVSGDRVGVNPHVRPSHPGSRLWWRLVGANNRPLGRSATSYPDLSRSLAAAEVVRSLGTSAAVDYLIDIDSGLRSWRLMHPTLDSTVLAVSARGYHRQRECKYSLEAFLAALPQAAVLAPQQSGRRPGPSSRFLRRLVHPLPTLPRADRRTSTLPHVDQGGPVPGRHAKPDMRLRVGAGLGTALGLLFLVPGGEGAVAPAAAAVASVTSAQPLLRLSAPLVQSLTGAAGLPAAPAPAASASRSAALRTNTRPTAPVVEITAIPRQVALAYLSAERRESRRTPGCHLPWMLLAGIGQIESGQARGRGPGTTGWDGTARPPILGPVLSGGAFAAMPDTDGGRLDGDVTWDRAVGPMQFLPSTWRSWGVDANADGSADPQSIEAAAAAAADYLCADGRDLATAPGVLAAVFSYNHSAAYVQAVLAAARAYPPAAPGAVVAALALAPVAASLAPVATPSLAPSAGPTPAGPTPAMSASPTLSPAPTVSPAPTGPMPTPSASPAASPESALPVEPLTTVSPTADPVASP